MTLADASKARSLGNVAGKLSVRSVTLRLNGKMRTVKGTIERHRTVESSTTVAAVVVCGGDWYVPGRCDGGGSWMIAVGMVESDGGSGPKWHRSSVAFALTAGSSVRAAKPAPLIVRRLAQPTAEPRGITSSKRSRAARTLGKRVKAEGASRPANRKR